MRGMLKQIRGGLQSLWDGLRQWSGDAAYETYVQSAARSGEKHQMSETEFYVEQLNRRYSRPNRCC
jgi:uncharacterized short protein YbdD (DUF466 family)